MTQQRYVINSLDVHSIDEDTTAVSPSEEEEGSLALGPLLEHTGIVFGGGQGKLIAHALYALALRDGKSLPLCGIDSDWLHPDPLRLADGQLVHFPKAALLKIGTTNTRNVLKEEPLLWDRYERRLRGIPVFETYAVEGHGGGGYPVISAADIDLSIQHLRQALTDFMRRITQRPTQHTFWRNVEQGRGSPPEMVAPRLVFPAGGCGSVGPAFHLLLPYLTRWVTRNLGLPDPYQIGVIAGPNLFTGLTKRTGANWLATMQQLDFLNCNGLQHYEFSNGMVIDDDAPPYSYIIMVDIEPKGETATQAELQSFAATVAKSLYTALCSDVFDKLESLVANDRRTPWTTLRGVLAQADVPVIEALAVAQRSANRLATLAEAPPH